MQTRVVWGALWLGSVILAWFLGGSTIRERARSERTPPARAKGMEPGKGKGNGEPAGEPPLERPSESARTTADASTPPPPPPTIDFDSPTTAKQFMDNAMALVDAHLRRGPKGHRDLLILISEISRNEDEISMLLAQDEQEAVRITYRWLRLLVKREAEVVGFIDGIFKIAAETPEWFEALDAGTLEFLTDGLGHLVPGMASDAELARIRMQLGRVLERDPNSLPAALLEQLESLREFHEAWAGPLATDEAHRLLLDPDLEPDEKFEILMRSPPAAVDGIDLAPILGPVMRELGVDEVIGQLSRFDLRERDRLALDEIVLDAITKDESARWMIGPYLVATKRNEWARQLPFIEEAVRRGGEVRSAMLYGLQSIEDVDEAYVHRLLTISDLTDAERRALESMLAGDKDR